MAQISLMQSFVANALEAVEFKLIRDPKNLDDAPSFHPEMAHQIFGDEENIFGYKDLKIQMFYSAGPLDVYFNIQYAKKVDDLKLDGLKADDLNKAIMELLPGSCFTDFNEFKSVFDKRVAEFKPVGEKIGSFEIEHGTPDGDKRTFEIYFCTMNTPNFLKYHAKFESFVYWYIDGASKLIHDPQWEYFVVYERYKDSSGNERFASVGYSTVYLYYSYPEKTRPRISQFLVLPPFQRMGVGSKLLDSMYSFYGAKENISDITVEDASDTFQQMRCCVDAKLCRTLEAFSPEKLKQKGLTQEMLNAAKSHCKINPKQCRVVYEILKLAAIDRNKPSEYQAYRLEIKKRLNMTHAKQKRDLDRAAKRGVNVTNALAMLPTNEQRLEQLQVEYKAVEGIYLAVIEKIGPGIY